MTNYYKLLRAPACYLLDSLGEDNRRLTRLPPPAFLSSRQTDVTTFGEQNIEEESGRRTKTYGRTSSASGLFRSFVLSSLSRTDRRQEQKNLKFCKYIFPLEANTPRFDHSYCCNRFSFETRKHPFTILG